MAKPELTEWDDDLAASPEEEYDALVRALQWTKGFGLLFVQCSPADGERLIARVRDDLTDKTVDVLRLEDEIDDLYETVKALPDIDNTNVLFVTGLEKSLVPYIKPGYGSEGDYYAKDTVPKLLGKLNLQREKFRETFGLCFVFLVPPYAMKYLIRRAADFFDWRSGVWEFVGSAEEVQQAAQRILQEGDYDEYLSWTPKQRRERMLEIDDLLADDNHSAGEISRLRFEQGNICAADQQFEWAIASYDAALAIKPDKHPALYNKGNALRNLGRYEEAIVSYDAALAIKPDKHPALYNKGNALRNLGRYEEAIVSYDAALAIKPDDHQALYNKGIALRKLGRHEEAIASYDAALVIKPDKHPALYNKGMALGNLGCYEEAVACYDAALAIKPDDHDALNNKGIALQKLGRNEEAIISLLKALELRPKLTWRERLQRFIFRIVSIIKPANQ
ncbi:tetratricopeptide repeat protein [Nodosilinea sp. LEGE 07088]|uniref:tetratricopeptide repeat protein n=1 Tax=Nodosilinea sp. LEGE 07088 TaxID=2777968 RepID=UPI00187FBE6E|nr:tetratricopeptide repeat protein [Nodosilinea sp. LEGE 07088]MBE9140361.1 tetratricopeptide repeat protein [Nodosilinea sp. LEGE 07088]